MRLLNRQFLRSFIALVALLLNSSLAQAALIDYEFTVITDTTDGLFNYFAELPSINNSGAVAFSADEGFNHFSIFVGSGDALTTIAAGDGAFLPTTSEPSINDAARKRDAA